MEVFEQMDNLLDLFQTFRQTRDHTMRSARTTRTQTPLPPARPAQQVSGLAQEFSLMAALLHAIDPTAALRSEADRVLMTFLERGALTVDQALGRRSLDEDTAAMLRDPVRALSDSGMSNEAISCIVKELGVALVVLTPRNSPNGPELKVFPDAAATQEDAPAVAIVHDGHRYVCEQALPDNARLKDVRWALLPRATKIAEELRPYATGSSKRLAAAYTLEKLQALAVAAAVPVYCSGKGKGSSKRTKQQLADLLVAAAKPIQTTLHETQLFMG